MADFQKRLLYNKGDNAAYYVSQAVNLQPKATSAMKRCGTLSFKNQIIYCGIDDHKNSWEVHLHHCGLELAKINMHPDTDKIERVRRSGKAPGRPQHKVKQLREQGLSMAAIAKECSISKTRVHQLIHQF